MRANDFVVPFLVIAVGWVVTRFQLREHHNSSFKLLCGREYIGKIAGIRLHSMRLLDVEVSMPEAYGVGSSEIDGTHLVLDFE